MDRPVARIDLFQIIEFIPPHTSPFILLIGRDCLLTTLVLFHHDFPLKHIIQYNTQDCYHFNPCRNPRLSHLSSQMVIQDDSFSWHTTPSSPHKHNYPRSKKVGSKRGVTCTLLWPSRHQLAFSYSWHVAHPPTDPRFLLDRENNTCVNYNFWLVLF